MPKKILISTFIGFSISVSTQAQAFNLLEYVSKKVEDTIESKAVDMLETEIKNKAESLIGIKSDNKLPDEKSQNGAKNSIKNAQKALPLKGDFRFAVPLDKTLETLEVGPRGGYIDWFGNEWVPVANGKGSITGWTEYLTKMGRIRIGNRLSRLGGASDEEKVIVQLDGKDIKLAKS